MLNTDRREGVLGPHQSSFVAQRLLPLLVGPLPKNLGFFGNSLGVKSTLPSEAKFLEADEANFFLEAMFWEVATFPNWALDPCMFSFLSAPSP